MANETAEQLRLLYEVSRRLATFTDLDELVRYATEQTRALFEAEGCALLVLDPTRREFSFPVASQRAAGTVAAERLAEIRFPAERGIAGWVVQHDEAALVADTASDARFYDGVDRSTTMHTRALLCAPLRTHTGTIGVLEVVNPAAACLTRDHLEFLEALAANVAVAHENAAMQRALRREVIGLRQMCTVVGSVLAVAGLAIGVGAVFAHLARALPLAELATRPGTIAAALCVAIGGALIGIGRGWVGAQPRPPTPHA